MRSPGREASFLRHSFVTSIRQNRSPAAQVSNPNRIVLVQTPLRRRFQPLIELKFARSHRQ